MTAEEMNNDGRPGGLSSVGSSQQAVSPVPASIPDATDDARLKPQAFKPDSYDGKPRNLSSRHQKLLASFVEPLWERLERMTKAELWEVIEACHAVSPINCAWSHYAMAGLLRDVAAIDFANRLDAQGIEAGTVETERLDAQHESPVACDAPNACSEDTSHDH